MLQKAREFDRNEVDDDRAIWRDERPWRLARIPVSHNKGFGCALKDLNIVQHVHCMLKSNLPKSRQDICRHSGVELGI